MLNRGEQCLLNIGWQATKAKVTVQQQSWCQSHDFSLWPPPLLQLYAVLHRVAEKYEITQTRPSLCSPLSGLVSMASSCLLSLWGPLIWGTPKDSHALNPPSIPPGPISRDLCFALFSGELRHPSTLVRRCRERGVGIFLSGGIPTGDLVMERIKLYPSNHCCRRLADAPYRVCPLRDRQAARQHLIVSPPKVYLNRG